MIIGVSGKAFSGKDTVANIIQWLILKEEKCVEIAFEDFEKYSKASDWKNVKFADKLKDMVCLLLGCTREQLEDREFKEKELGEEWWYWKSKHTNSRYIPFNEEYIRSEHFDLIKLTPRLLLQLLGTECGRNIIHPNIWCNSLFSDYNGDFEEWMDIIDYENSYQISSFGRVKSLDRKIVYGGGKGQYHTKKSQFLKPTLSGGYETVSLSGKTFTVHSLVAKHFVKGYQEGFVVNHIDYNKTNNFYKNLEWITQEDNIKHNKTTLRGNFGEAQKDAKLDSDKVLAIRKLIEDKTLSQNKIAKLFSVSPTTISDIKKGKKWNHVGKDIIEVAPILPILTPNWIISDVRFPNEARAVKDRNGILIRLNRNTGLESMHESETALDNYDDWDYIIENNDTIEDLIEKVKEILIKEKIIWKAY